MTAPIVIVGSLMDPHVKAVHTRIADAEVVVLDAASLAHIDFTVTIDRIMVGCEDREIDLSRGWRGWIRRLSPPDWEDGVVIGSHDAAAMAAWLSLLATVLRHPEALWLTDLDPMTAAENKMSQYIAASRLGLAVPAAMITNSRLDALRCSKDLIAKPLGPGHFRTGQGEWRTVFTEAFDPTGPDGRLLAGPPFIVQDRAKAICHKRVVTVADRAWAFTLDGKDLPVDWREEARAHREWKRDPNERLESDALRLARNLDVGYTSQDWIETSDGLEFVDLNPAGQWLFLPDPGAAEVSDAIAEWLMIDQ